MAQSAVGHPVNPPLEIFFIVRGRSRLQQFPFEQLGQELCCVLS